MPGQASRELTRGGQLPQNLVRRGESICLSDNVLGDHLTLVGFGVDPRAQLDELTRARWQGAHGRFLQIGLRGQSPAGDMAFAEDLSDALVPGIRRGWVAVVRPDRVVMHDGPAHLATVIANDCMRLLAD